MQDRLRTMTSRFPRVLLSYDIVFLTYGRKQKILYHNRYTYNNTAPKIIDICQFQLYDINK